MPSRQRRRLLAVGSILALAWLPGCDDDDIEDIIDELDDVNVNINVVSRHTPSYDTIVIWPRFWSD